ncbi:MAG: bifunctional nuclease family protein [Bacteroidetes bacterium]|nr:bifunctional nuclease family protein [Bacteroidota bacterium]
MEKIRLEIIGMSYSQSQTGAYALILGEKDGKRRLPIIIGGFEAQAIAIELEKIKTPRPLTHDLFKSFADAFSIEVSEIIINKFQEGVFYAQLVCSDGTRVEEVDSRTSDAIALALRFNCPIYTYEDIMKSASIMVEEDSDAPSAVTPGTSLKTSAKKEFADQSIGELNEMLQAAVDNEEYEKASRIRDELNRRNKTRK